MITRISRKRTSRERHEWEFVRSLMPRGRKTRGLQYEVLEYLFLHLYEKVPESELRDHLIKVKGALQKTGDPVKGAINQAVKELQRLPHRVFDLIKLQEADTSNQIVRYVQLTFNRYDAVISFDEYQEYVEDLLAGESQMMIRLTVAHLRQEATVFPGFARWRFDDHHVQAVLCLSARDLVRHRRWDCRYVPDSPIGGNMLLIYENQDMAYPFLGFICDDDLTEEANCQFILYRGQEKLSKLTFLDRLWRASFQRARPPEEILSMQKQLEQDTGDWNEAHFQGLIQRQCMNVSHEN